MTRQRGYRPKDGPDLHVRRDPVSERFERELPETLLVRAVETVQIAFRKQPVRWTGAAELSRALDTFCERNGLRVQLQGPTLGLTVTPRRR